MQNVEAFCRESAPTLQKMESLSPSTPEPYTPWKCDCVLKACYFCGLNKICGNVGYMISHRQQKPGFPNLNPLMYTLIWSLLSLGHGNRFCLGKFIQQETQN